MEHLQRILEYILGSKISESNFSPALQILLIGCILKLIGQSVCPGQLSFKQRVRSLIDYFKDEAAQQLAKDGIHGNGVGGASCCHCGARVDSLKTAGESGLPRVKHQPDCMLLQLLALLERKPTMTEAELSRNAEEINKLIRKISFFLKDSKVGLVQTFGFQEAETALAALRLFFIFGQGSQLWRPGDLIHILHTFQQNNLDSSIFFPLLESVSEREPIDRRGNITTRHSLITNDNINAEEAVPRFKDSPAEARIQKELEDSPLCHLCRTRPRAVVLLPCAHLLYCRECALGIEKCPACGADVLSEKSIFLT